MGLKVSACCVGVLQTQVLNCLGCLWCIRTEASLAGFRVRTLNLGIAWPACTCGVVRGWLWGVGGLEGWREGTYSQTLWVCCMTC